MEIDMNRSAKGRRNEWKAIRYFEQQGYVKAGRSAASKGVWDFVMSSKDCVLFVQVKTNHPPSKREIADMQDFPCPPTPYAKKLIVLWHDYQRHPEVHEL